MILEIRKDIQPLKNVDFTDSTVNYEMIVNDMLDTMIHYKFYSINTASLYVERVKIFIIGNPYNRDDHSVFVNPKVIWQSDEKIKSDETCLHLPGFVLPIKRHKEIRVRFFDQYEHIYTEKFSGLTSRIVQYNIDLFDNKTIKHRANRFHYEKEYKKYGNSNTISFR